MQKVKKFKVWFAEQRLNKGLTQKEFARLLGKRESEISKWMTGRHNFTTQTIARIESVLGNKVLMIAK